MLIKTHKKHEKKKPHSFSQNTLAVHDGKKPFQCDNCDYAVFKCHLEKHIASVHDKKKPFYIFLPTI